MPSDALRRTAIVAPPAVSPLCAADPPGVAADHHEPALGGLASELVRDSHPRHAPQMPMASRLNKARLPTTPSAGGFIAERTRSGYLESVGLMATLFMPTAPPIQPLVNFASLATHRPYTRLAPACLRARPTSLRVPPERTVSSMMRTSPLIERSPEGGFSETWSRQPFGHPLSRAECFRNRLSPLERNRLSDLGGATTVASPQPPMCKPGQPLAWPLLRLVLGSMHPRTSPSPTSPHTKPSTAPARSTHPPQGSGQ